jgi:hypothetical protein
LDHLSNPDLARQDAVKVVRFFLDAGLAQIQVRVWFSGKKGFHLTVDPFALGAQPHPELHLHYKQLALFLVEHLGLTTADLKIYTCRRMWRLADSIHGGTGLYSVEVSFSELAGSIDSIWALAGAPRGPVFEEFEYPANSDSAPNEILSDLFLTIVEEWQSTRHNSKTMNMNMNMSRTLSGNTEACQRKRESENTFTHCSEEYSQQPPKPPDDCVAPPPPEPPGSTMAVNTAITATQPSGYGRRNSSLFRFARHLKAIPELRDAPIEALNPHVAEWWRNALARIRTKPFEESRRDFERAWGTARFAKDDDVLGWAFQCAQRMAPVPAIARLGLDEQYDLIARLCIVLRDASRRGSFFLGGRDLGRLLGIHWTRAAARLRRLVAVGFLEIVRRGTRAGLAMTYRLGQMDSGQHSRQ